MATTFGDMIYKVRRRIGGLQREVSFTLTSNITAGATSFQVTDPTSGSFAASLRPGCVLSIDLEVFLVQNVTGSGPYTVTVVPGYAGSTQAAHSAAALCFVDPKFSYYDIGTAINDDLLDLSAPGNGLYAVGSVDLTYTPPYMGYDLAGVPTGFLGLLSVDYKHAYPDRNRPKIKRWKVLRQRTAGDSDFPSGNGLVIYEDAYPGLPVHVVYAYPFTQFSTLTDDATTVAGLSSTMYDIPCLGAEIALVSPREVQRNFMSAQGDARKAQEVPPGAVMNSVTGQLRLRASRIGAEADRLRREWGFPRDASTGY